MTREEKLQWVDTYDRAGNRIDWRRGDVVVACNVRTAHGRPSITLGENERRRLGVVLGPMMRKRGVRADKW